MIRDLVSAVMAMRAGIEAVLALAERLAARPPAAPPAAPAGDKAPAPPHRPRTLGVAALLLWLAALVPGAAAAAQAPPTLCTTGRLLVAGKALLGKSTVTDAVRLTAGSVSIESGCDPVATKLRRRRKATVITASWRSCTGVKGRVRLRARFDKTCSRLRGVLTTRKGRRAFRATPQGPPEIRTAAFTPVPLSSASVGRAGGTLTVTGGPLAGLAITVPPEATDEPVTFSVSYAPIESLGGLPPYVQAAGSAIRIETSGSEAWNAYRLFRRPVHVTLPYAEPASGEETVRFYRLDPDGGLEPTGLDRQDLDANTLTFLTRTFADTAPPSVLPAASAAAPGAARIGARSVGSRVTFATYVALGLGEALAGYLSSGRSIDTGFRPKANGFYIPNYGSYYRESRGGNCFGMVGAAKHYYKRGFAPPLYGNYRDPLNSPTWADDAVAIEYVSRVQNGFSEVLDAFWRDEVTIQSQSRLVLSVLSALDVTGAPALLVIGQLVPGVGGAPPSVTGAHAIAVYRVSIAANGTVTFFVYDPNYPGDETRHFVYTPGSGIGIYESGVNAASSVFHYNFFAHANFYVGMTYAALDAVKAAADDGFADDSVFPHVTITRIVGATNGEVVYDAASGTKKEGTTEQGERKYITADKAVRVEGTVTGGFAQHPCCVVNKAHVIVSGQPTAETSIANAPGGGDGSFAVTVPLLQGENEFVMIAAGPTPYDQWAAFYRTVIESTATPAALTVTLTWDRGDSDLDLYVREPNTDPGVTPAKTGQTVYFGHRYGESPTHPYLDLDNTRGFGPEHYYAKVGTTPLYTDGSEAGSLHGYYRVRVHFYADKDADHEHDGPIGWTLRWRYLAFCPDPCTNPDQDGFWVEGLASGELNEADGGNCCDITHEGGDWSSPVLFEYPKPDPLRWMIPDPPGIMLP